MLSGPKQVLQLLLTRITTLIKQGVIIDGGIFFLCYIDTRIMLIMEHFFFIESNRSGLQPNQRKNIN